MQSIFTKEQFLAFRAAFRRSANNKLISSTDIALYNVIRGLDVGRGFTPATNPKKLANGHHADYSLNMAKMFAKSRLMSRFNKYNPVDYFKEMYGVELSDDQTKALAELLGWKF